MDPQDHTVSFAVDGVAVVTGAAQGLGQAAAVALAQREKCTVAYWDRNP